MAMKFFNSIGKVAIGSRIRLLGEKFSEDAQEIYELYGLQFNPKWFSLFILLSEGEKTVTELAESIGISHVAVSKTLKELTSAGLVKKKSNKEDKRSRKISLSDKGNSFLKDIQLQCRDVEKVVEEISSQAKYDLWKALEEWEYLLEEKSFLERVKKTKKERETSQVQIVKYDPQYKKAFRDLNIQWITNFFEMEEADFRALDNPEAYILQNGGEIFVALFQNEAVGVCALLKRNDEIYPFELAKMAVNQKIRGKGIGYLLGQSIIEEARRKGATNLYLESNTVLGPAIKLYQKLGFKKVVGLNTPYKRCNIQMELEIS